MLRSYTIIDGQHITAKAPATVLNRKIPVNIFHRADVAATVKLENHTACTDSGRTQIFHFKMLHPHDLIFIIRRTDPCRFLRVHPVFPGLDLVTHGRIHHVLHHIPHQFSPQTHFSVLQVIILRLKSCLLQLMLCMNGLFIFSDMQPPS